ncbi:MAG TPA: hypothetical protein VGG74_20550 [Kofleriaceae bacterium]|jgi:hypothetical protein
MTHRWLVLAASLSACAPSVLVHPDDDTYRRSIEHFRHVRELVAASTAPDDEQLMFLQAEALFRYRFAMPSHSTGSWFAETAAAVTDLPVFESLASSLDLVALRLRTVDGAVQLWETLLQRDPKTPLRALADYQLGWAYRNAIASGFPRDTDRAFDDLSACCKDSPLTALAAEARRVRWKSQARAAVWSLVPGLGQMYVGHYASGTVRLAIALATTAMVFTPAAIAFERRDDLSWHNDWPLLVVGAVGATLLAIDYSSSYQDAMRGVLEYNEQREDAFEAAHPDAP